jgi:serine/threonine protein kinase
MSPEQARGKESDFRTDLWAMCVVLYELVTGELPFDGDNWNAIMHAILGKDPRPITDFDVGDATLWTIIERGLSKDIGERWESAQLLGRALASWLVSVGVYEDITGRTLTKMWRVDDLDEVLSSRRPDPESDDPFARPSLSSIPDSSGGWTPYSSDKGLLRRTPLSGSTGPAAASHATDDDLRSSLITSASDRAPMPGAAPTGARRVQLVALGALAACIVAVAIWRLSGPDTTARGDEPPTPQAMTTAAPEPNATHPSKATATAPAAGPEEAKPEEVVAPAMSVSALPVIVAPPSWTAPAPPRPAAPAGPPPPPLASPPRPPPPPPPPALKPPSFD